MVNTNWLSAASVGFQPTDGATRQSLCKHGSALAASSVLVSVVPLVGLGVDLQHGTLGRHLERTGVCSVVLGQRDTVAVDLRDRLLALNRHDADVHVRAGVHLVVAVDFLLTVVGHGRGTIAVLVDDQSVVTLLTLLAAALRATVTAGVATRSAVAT